MTEAHSQRQRQICKQREADKQTYINRNKTTKKTANNQRDIDRKKQTETEERQIKRAKYRQTDKQDKLKKTDRDRYTDKDRQS